MFIRSFEIADYGNFFSFRIGAHGGLYKNFKKPDQTISSYCIIL